ncbi:hypothetical protein ACH5RR_006918 [Cinchona calisaya]|uniref:Uncharacterized protein n=1 Tax=Cinchona calisaya TaxID=153742 RepID=A0ABD3AQR6_9GENT
MDAWGSAFQSGYASALLQVVFDRFATFAWKEISLIWGVDDELRKLQRTFLKIQAVVDRVEASNMRFFNSSGNRAWQMWVEDLKKLSYDADDLLDKITLDLTSFSANRSLDAHHNNQVQVRDMLLSSFQVNLPKKISEIQNKLEGLAREMDSVLMNDLVKLGSHDIATTRLPHGSTFSETSSFLDDELVIGREHDKGVIKKLLLDDNGLGRKNVSVIPIVGMCGIGKTTLTQVLYNDIDVRKNFELRMWISVCVDFDVVKITKAIIESATQKPSKLSKLDPLQVKLQHILGGKRFFLVLDDLWDEKRGDWEILSSPFRFGSKGSKVIVTTRSTIASSIVGSVPSHRVEFLSDENCWELIQKVVFANQSAEMNEGLGFIGRNIAKKCKGLPLVAKILGGVMQFEINEKAWDCILKSELWELPLGDNVFPALSLSYHFLPSDLQKCFAYCSIFPRDHEFEMDDLVRRWMAEGFIRPVGEKRLEDIGRDYFKGLLFRSFFQISQNNGDGKFVFKMHHLIHTIAQLVSTDICFRVENGMLHCYPLFRHVRHMSLHLRQHDELNAFHGNKRLRTLQVSCENNSPMCQIPADLFLKLQFLRVLDLSHIGLSEVAESIDNLNHLRYLNLSENRIQKLPESLSNILALQTLGLRNCHDLLELPRNFKNLRNLRHLDLNIKGQHRLMPSGVGMLTGLQNLEAFIVGKNEGYGIEELKNMNFLQGSICIQNLENVPGLKEAEEAMLDKKLLLLRLELEWSEGAGSGEEILGGLKPPENLRELVIINYSGSSFPGWLSDSRCKLSSIYLQGIKNCYVLPSLRQLPCLTVLHIEDMFEPSSADQFFHGFDDNIGFPLLESLTFSSMPNWMGWNGLNTNDMPCLRDLTIEDCPVLISLPALCSLHSLRNLDISRCPELQSLPELPVSLMTLVILECPILENRCKVEEGEDWRKIRTITHVEINYKKLSGDL